MPADLPEDVVADQEFGYQLPTETDTDQSDITSESFDWDQYDAEWN